MVSYALLCVWNIALIFGMALAMPVSLIELNLKPSVSSTIRILQTPLIPSLSAVKWSHSPFSITITLVIALPNLKIGCLSP